MAEFRSGTVDVIVPRSLSAEDRQRHIEEFVQSYLSKTGEWAVRIDANTGVAIDGDEHRMRWSAHFRTGPFGQFEE